MRHWFLITAAFCALYAHTLSADILPADSGEFQLVAAQLGLAHPPGFPLYTLLAHGFTYLPLPSFLVGNTAAQINLFSALTSALTLGVVGWATAKLAGYNAAGWLAATTLGTSTTFWAQATTANIRSLTGLLTAVAIATLIALHHSQNPTHRQRALFGFALALGLGLTHHLSLAFMAVVLGLFALWEEPSLLQQPRRWPMLLAAVAIALLPLLYLPLRDPTLRTWADFWHYALALGFQGDFFYFNTAAQLALRLRVMGNILLFQFNPLLLLAMLGGLLRIGWQRPRLALLLGGSSAVHTLIVATYRAPQAVEYLLPIYVVLVMGLAGLWNTSEPRKITNYQLPITLLAFTLPLAQLLTTYPSMAWLRAQNDTRAYVQTILDGAPEGSAVLADWHWATPLWFAQQVEGQRPDLVIEFVYPQTADYSADWLGRIESHLADGRPVIATHLFPAYVNLPPSQSLGEAVLFPQTPLTQLPPTFIALANPQLPITNYQLPITQIPAGEEFLLTVAWTGTEPLPLFAHLVGFDGLIYAQDDVTARPQPEGITLTQLRLTPRWESQPGDFALFVGISGQERVQIGTVRVEARPWKPHTTHPTWRRVGERTLIGYDWDNTLPIPRLYLHWRTSAGYTAEVYDLPDGRFTLPTGREVVNDGRFYVPLGHGLVWAGSTRLGDGLTPGEVLTVRQTFHATRPVVRDVGIAVRLIGFEADGFTWAWLNPDPDTDIPALGAIPTLKWIAGSTISHPRLLTVAPQAQTGQVVGGSVRPYDVFTNRPLPLLDGRLAASNQPWLPLPLSSVE